MKNMKLVVASLVVVAALASIGFFGVTLQYTDNGISQTNVIGSTMSSDYSSSAIADGHHYVKNATNVV